MIARSFLLAARFSAPSVRTPVRNSLSSLIRSRTTIAPIKPSWGASLQKPSARWYSDAAEQKVTNEAAPTATPKESEAADVEALSKELEAKKKEITVLKDQYLRQVADYQNLQTRTKRDAQAARDFALQGFVKDLVSSIDNLEHALAAVPAEKLAAPAANASVETVHKDLFNLHQGLTMIETVLINVLKKHGVTRFDPAETSEVFDPNMHEAVFQAPMQGKTDGTVFHTQQKGFMLNGRVIRAAQVGVVKNS